MTEISFAVLAGLCFNENISAFFSMRWFTYFCPVTRLFDFFIGCCLGYLFLHRRKIEYSKWHYSMGEFLTVIYIACSFAIYKLQITVFGAESVRNTLLFLPSSMALIWLTATNGKLLKKILKSRILVFIGNLSPYIFLIHVMVIRYFRAAVHMILPEFPSSIICLVAFGATVVMALSCDRLCKKKMERAL